MSCKVTTLSVLDAIYLEVRCSNPRCRLSLLCPGGLPVLELQLEAAVEEHSQHCQHPVLFTQVLTSDGKGLRILEIPPNSE